MKPYFLKSPIDGVFPTTITIGQNATDAATSRLNLKAAFTSDEAQPTAVKDSHLFVGDETGRIQVWDILTYCIDGPALDPPKCKSFGRILIYLSFLLQTQKKSQIYHLVS